MILIFYPNWAG